MNPSSIADSIEELYRTVQRLRALLDASYARLPTGETVELVSRQLADEPRRFVWSVRHADGRERVYSIEELTPITPLEALAEQSE